MSKGVGFVKSRERFTKMMELVPERAEFYLEKIAECNAKIMELGVCRRCGRPLKSDEARAIGYGKECLKQTEEGSDSRSDGLRPIGEGYSGELSGGEGMDKVGVR